MGNNDRISENSAEPGQEEHSVQMNGNLSADAMLSMSMEDVRRALSELQVRQTALAQSEEALKRQNSLFSTLLNNLPMGVFMVEAPSGKPLVANDAARRLLGRGILPNATRSNLAEVYKAHKLGGTEPYPPEEMPILLGMSGVSAHVNDLVVERPNGTQTLLEVFGTPVKDEKGEIWASLVSFQDITKRKRVERALKENQELLLKSQEIAHVGSWILDSGTNRLLWSDEVYRIFGVSPHEFAGTHEGFMELVHPEDCSLQSDAYFGSIRDKNSGYEVEYRIIRRDTRQVRFVREKCEHVRDASGNILRSVGMVQDITEQKQNDLEIIRSREAAEAASNATSRFLANMSHEIRTPMNGMLGMLQLLEMTPLTEEQQEFIRISRSSADVLLVLINDILDYSKIGAGKMSLERTPFSLSELMGNVTGLFMIPAAEKELTLEAAIAKDLPDSLVGDPFRLRQILSNLIGNAVKFTNTGRIDVSARKMENRNDREIILEFTVRDTGIGIPKNRLNTLFRSFSQVDSSDTRKYGGTGLGLAISKSLVELMGGNIWVTGEEGEGSCFSFTCVLGMADMAKDEEKPLPANRGAPGSGWIPGKPVVHDGA